MSDASRPEGDPGLQPGAEGSGEPPAEVEAPGEPPTRAEGSPESLPGKADGDGWHRLHPLTPLLQGGIVLLVIIGVIIANLRDFVIEIIIGRGGGWDGGDDGENLIEVIVANGLMVAVIAGVFALVLLIVFFSWLSWRFLSYRITAEAVESRKGVLFRQHRRAPLERIQSVNLKRPLLARIIGLAQVEVQTAGQGGKVDLSFLSHADAKRVREQILRDAARSRRQAAARRSPSAAGASLPAAPAGETGLDSASPAAQLPAAPRDPSLEHVGAAGPAGAADAREADADATAGGFGERLTRRADDFIDFDIDPEAEASGALVRVPVGRLIASLLLSTEMLVFAVLAIAFVVLAIIFTPAVLVGVIPLPIVIAGLLISQFNKGFNFTLSRTSDGVRIGAGLTATNTESIPFGRIHAVQAYQPIGWRPLGWWKVRTITAGHSVAQGGQNQAQNIVLPVGGEADVLRVIETLFPGVGDQEHEIAELRNGLSGAGAGYLGAGRRSGWVLWFGRRRAGLQILGESYDDETTSLRIRRGALTRSFILMPVLRAQSVQLRRPLVHRMLGLASIQAHTVLGPVIVQMRGLDLERARETFDVLARTVVRIQSTEADRRAALDRPRATADVEADAPGAAEQR